MARRRADDLPLRVEVHGGRFYYRPGSLGRKAGESRTTIPLGGDREEARRLALRIQTALDGGAPPLIPVTLVESHLRALLSRARHRATKTRRGFDLDLAYLIAMANRQRHRCALTGIPFSLERGRFRAGPWLPSIDRRDSRLGYTKGNVRLVCLAVNMTLNEWGDGVLRIIGEAISRKASGIPFFPEAKSDVSS